MSRFAKESIDRFYDYHIHIETRTIYMGSASATEEGEESGTDFAMAENIVKALHILESQAPQGDKPITIIMNNHGGDEVHGMAIYDAIKACQNHVTIKVFGHAMSMGSIILQAADERILSPNSKVMIHYGTAVISDTMHSKIVTKWAKENEKFNTKMEELYLEKIKEKHPSYTIAKVKKLCDYDTILNAQEAVDLGLADKILGE